jgi:branched-chain amino acid transport system substrate-binding protein
MKRLIVGALGIGLLIIVSVGATFHDSGQEPLLIGLIPSRSGFQAPLDAPAEAAVKLAADDFNAKGGILGRKIEFVLGDAKSDPAVSANAAADVLSKGAKFLIVSCDYDIGGPAARLAQDRKVVSFSLCASSPKWNSIGPLAYSMSFGSLTEGAVEAQWALQGKLHCEKAYLLTDTLIDYTRTISETIKRQYKGDLVGEDTFKNSDPSFAAQVSRLQSSTPRPDCIFLTSFPPGGATLIRQLRAAGITQPIISDEGMAGAYWLKATPDLSDFYISGYASPFGDDPNPRVNAIAKRLQQRPGVSRLTGGEFVSGYSLMEALKLAVQRAKSTDTTKVVKALQGFRQVPLLMGPTTFTKKDRQSLGRPMRIMQIQNGKPSFLVMFKPTGCTASSC